MRRRPSRLVLFPALLAGVGASFCAATSATVNSGPRRSMTAAVAFRICSSVMLRGRATALVNHSSLTFAQGDVT